MYKFISGVCVVVTVGVVSFVCGAGWAVKSIREDQNPLNRQGIHYNNRPTYSRI